MRNIIIKPTNILLTLFFTALLCSMLLSEKAHAANVVANGICGDNLTWELDSEGTLTVRGTGDMNDYLLDFDEKSSAPWVDHITEIKNVVISSGVTSVGNNAFNGCYNLLSVSIPDSVTRIGFSSFEDCCGMTSIKIPSSVTYIDGRAFIGCSGLKGVYITDLAAWCSIGYCFGGAGSPLYCAHNLYLNGELITDLVIPDSLTVIGDGAFYGCTSLTSVFIPDSVTGIGYGTFNGCTGLTSVDIPDSVIYIGRSAFSNCSGLTSVKLGNSVESIEKYAFSNCKGLTTLHLPDSLTFIGTAAFGNCCGLNSINIPSSVTFIGEAAFSNCFGLTSVHITDLEAWCKICFATYNDNHGGNPLSHAKKLYLNGELLTILVIPSGVTSIENYTFYGCREITTIFIPDSVKSIGKRAFYGCRDLVSVYMPKSLTKIGSEAFYGCYGLKSVYISDLEAWCRLSFIDLYSNPLTYGHTLYLNGEIVTDLVAPDSIDYIPDYSFSGCNGLSSIQLPKNVNIIGISAFKDCTELKYVELTDGLRAILSDAFSGCISLTAVSIPDSVTSIDISAFSYCSDLSSIAVSPNNPVFDSRQNCNAIIQKHFNDMPTNALIIGCKNTIIPEGVASIKDYAFCGCSGLTAVTIPDSVTKIGKEAFAYCSGISSIIVSQNNPVYDSRESCNAIIETATNTLILGCKNTIIPNIIHKILDYSFSGCNELTSLTIPDSVTNIGNYAFSRCTGLSSITVSNNNPVYDSRELCNAIIETSTNSLLLGCKNSVIPDSVTSIGNSAFEECEYLINVTIPQSVTAIGDNAFKGNSRMVNVIIPNSVINIGAEAFSGCSGLSEIVLPKSVETIGEWAFSNCHSLHFVSIPEGLERIEKAAFYDCTGLNLVIYSGSKAQWYSLSIGDLNTDLTGATYSSDNLYTGSCGDRLIYSFDPSSKTLVISGSGEMTDFQQEAPWELFEKSIISVEFPDNITHIGAHAFDGCCTLSEVLLPESITSIGEHAFSGCTSLTGLYLPESLIFVGKSALSDCTGLESITLPGCVCEVASVFSGCSNLKSVRLSNGFTSIGAEAFLGCTNLNLLYLPRSVRSIGEDAFLNCEKLNDIRYSGSESDFNMIKVADGNYILFSAQLTYAENPLGEAIADIIEVNPLKEENGQSISVSIFCAQYAKVTAVSALYGADGQFLCSTSCRLTPGRLNELTLPTNNAFTVRIYTINDEDGTPVH